MMTDNVLKSQAFKLKGRLYTFTVLQLVHSEPVLFAETLDDMTAKAPRLFDNAPVVLDCSLLAEEAFDLPGICHLLRARHIFPVAIQGANPFHCELAKANGLAVLHASSSHDKTLMDPSSTQPQSASHAPTPESAKNRLITTPIRSGQQVVVKGGDLTVTASVSHGAELLADGHIHVYGALRGRALAGISGDKQARIFCQSLDAELISIAGFYRLSDAIVPHQGPCQIFLQDEHIHIEPL